MTTFDEQVSETGVVDIDHVMCLVDDMDEARSTYERLGFTLTPFGRHEALGSGNSLVLLTPRTPGRANFIELAATGGNPLSPLMARILEGDEGPKMIVHLLDDAQAARDHWEGCGLEVTPSWSFQRSWKLPDGEVIDFDVEVTICDPASTPFNLDGYKPNDLRNYLREELMSHPNGARHWSAITAVAPERDKDRVVALYERIYGVAAVARGSTAVIAPGDVELRITSAPEDALPGVDVGPVDAPRLVGLTIEVDELDRAERHLRQVAPLVDGRDALVVPPAQACGIALEFVPTDHGR